MNNLSNSEKAKMIKDLTSEMLSSEKKNIINAMKDLVGEEEYAIKASGDSRWTYHMNIGENLREGRGINDMKNYFWINVSCDIKKNGKFFATEHYSINFQQQDFDLKTGNIHVHIDGKIQIWKNLIEHSGCEKNGDVRLGGIAVSDIDDELGDNIFKCSPEEKIYKFYHAPYNAFPIALPYGQRDKKRVDKPWGMSLEEIGKESIPSMDIADTEYDSVQLADFFVKLIKADLARKISC